VSDTHDYNNKRENPMPLNRNKLFAKTLSESESIVEENISLVWLGSTLREKHLERIKKWKATNPSYNASVYVEPQFVKTIQKQFGKEDVAVISVEELKIPEQVKQTIQKFIEPRADGLPPNYAAASDFYRFYIINSKGGRYADTDIPPFALNKQPIDKDLKFLVRASRNAKNLTMSTPDIFAACANGDFSQTALSCIELMCTQMTPEVISLIRSNIASTRLFATMYSTGGILTLLFYKMFFDGVPIKKGTEVTNSKIFDRVTSTKGSFDVTEFESSWIEAENSHQAKVPKPIDGIILDKDYLQWISFHEKSDSIYKAITPILDLDRFLFANMKIKEISTKKPLVPQSPHKLFAKKPYSKPGDVKEAAPRYELRSYGPVRKHSN